MNLRFEPHADDGDGLLMAFANWLHEQQGDTCFLAHVRRRDGRQVLGVYDGLRDELSVITNPWSREDAAKLGWAPGEEALVVTQGELVSLEYVSETSPAFRSFERPREEEADEKGDSDEEDGEEADDEEEDEADEEREEVLRPDRRATDLWADLAQHLDDIQEATIAVEQAVVTAAVEAGRVSHSRAARARLRRGVRALLSVNAFKEEIEGLRDRRGEEETAAE